MRRVFFIFFGIYIALGLVACGSSQGAQELPQVVVQPTDPNQQVDSPESVEQNAVDTSMTVPGKLLAVNNANLVMISGDKTTHLTSSGKKFQPTWSPDGKQVAYVQREESFSDLWVMNIDGSEKVQVTNNEPEGIPARSETHVTSIKWAFYPAWSPDSSLLAYISQAVPPSYYSNPEVPFEYPLSLYLYGTRRLGDGVPAGASFEQLAKTGYDLMHPTWAEDSLLLVYTQASREQAEPLTLGFFNFDTGASGLLQGQSEDQFLDAMDADLSSDGRWMSYVKRSDTSSDLWVVPAPDSQGQVVGSPQQLTTNKRIRMPTWSPDSKKLAFFEARNNTIYLNIADVQSEGAGKLSLKNITELWHGNFDVDSGMSWVK